MRLAAESGGQLSLRTGLPLPASPDAGIEIRNFMGA